MSSARDYLGPELIFLDRTFECQECGALTSDRVIHDQWHETVAQK